MKRLLVLAYHYPPDQASGAARPHRWVRYLRAHQYEADVISVPKDSPGSFGDRMIQRLMPYNERYPWARAAVDACGPLLARHQYVAVISSAPPLAVHFAAWRLRHRHKLPWVADFRDPVVGNPFRDRRWADPYDSFVEWRFVRSAGAVVANTEAAGQALRERYPSRAARIHVIWNGFDPADHIEARPVAEGVSVMVHAGSVYGGRHPRLLLESLARSQAKVKVRLIGEFEQSRLSLSDPLCEQLIAAGILEVTPHSVPQPEARQAIEEAHYLLLLDLNEQNAGLQVPAKLFEYIRVGRPILAFTACGSAVEWILSKAGVPCLDDAESIA